MTPRTSSPTHTPRRGASPAGARAARPRGERSAGADDASLDAVFHALAHPMRRRLLDLVRASPGCNVNDACRPFDVSRIAVMKHLRVLEDAGLLVSRKAGRSRELYFNVVPIQRIYDRWTSDYASTWARRLLDLKRLVEAGGPEPGAERHDDPPAEDAT